MEKLIEALYKAIEENDFMIIHEKKKLKEVNKTIKQLIKINEKIENKVDVEPYMVEREQHLKQLTEFKLKQRKLSRIFKIVSSEVDE